MFGHRQIFNLFLIFSISLLYLSCTGPISTPEKATAPVTGMEETPSTEVADQLPEEMAANLVYLRISEENRDTLSIISTASQIPFENPIFIREGKVHISRAFFDNAKKGIQDEKFPATGS